jgi:hypothetical protein
MDDKELQSNTAEGNLPFHEDEIDQSEEMRSYKAKQFDLPETTSWDDVIAFEDKKIHKDSAKVLGLDESASWEQILSAEDGEGERVSAALLLGLPKDATYGEITELRDKKKTELHRKIAQEMVKNRK